MLISRVHLLKCQQNLEGHIGYVDELSVVLDVYELYEHFYFSVVFLLYFYLFLSTVFLKKAITESNTKFLRFKYILLIC